MRLHGQRADHESLRDVGIAEAAGDEIEDLAFPLGQLGQRRRGPEGWGVPRTRRSAFA
jgi:hypothetical protein